MKAFETKAKIDIPLKNTIIKQGEKVTITEVNDKFYIWHPDGIYLLDEEYLDKERHIISDN